MEPPHGFTLTLLHARRILGPLFRASRAYGGMALLRDGRLSHDEPAFLGPDPARIRGFEFAPPARLRPHARTRGPDYARLRGNIHDVLYATKWSHQVGRARDGHRKTRLPGQLDNLESPERPRLRFGAILVGFGFAVRGDPEHDQHFFMSGECLTPNP